MTTTPHMNIATGEFIREELETRNWKQEDLAEILGVSPKTVNHLVNSKQALSLDMAKLLSKAFGQSPQYWINIDTNYRLRLRPETREETSVAVRGEIFSHFPVKEMTKKGWLKKYSSADQMAKEITQFFGWKSLDFSRLEKEELPAFRKSEAYTHYNKFYALTWFTMARRCVSEFKVPVYNRNRLERFIEELRGYTIRAHGVAHGLRELNKCGVKFFVLDHLQKTYIDGASFHDGRNPVIVYTCRHNRIDNFWFTLVHEIGHVLKHFKNKDDSFIDNLDAAAGDKREREADNFAVGAIDGENIRKYFSGNTHYISEARVQRCSDELQLHPAIIVGYLQHIHALDRKNLNRFKDHVDALIPAQYWVERHL